VFDVKARYPKNILDFLSKPSPCPVELIVIVAYRMVLEAITSDTYSLLVEPRNLAEKNLVRWMRAKNRTITAYTKRFAWVRVGFTMRI
jgi:hypothetical protein